LVTGRKTQGIKTEFTKKAFSHCKEIHLAAEIKDGDPRPKTQDPRLFSYTSQQQLQNHDKVEQKNIDQQLKAGFKGWLRAKQKTKTASQKIAKQPPSKNWYLARSLCRHVYQPQTGRA